MPETKKIVYAGIWETEESFYAVDFDGFMTFHLSKEEFQDKVTDVKTVFN